MIFGLCTSTCFSAASLLKSHCFFFLQRKRDWRGAMRTSAVIGKEKKSPMLPSPHPHLVFFWIDKDFWFRSFPFLPLPPSFTSFPLSLLFHSVYFWHRKIRREREKKRCSSRRCKRWRKNNVKEKSTREEEIALV